MQVRKYYRVVTRRVHSFYWTVCLLRHDEYQLRNPLW
jgi:hypothetical protein